MYKQNGLLAFQLAAKDENWRTPVMFYFIYHRIKKDKLQPQSRQDWKRLLDEYVNLPNSIERRYTWSNLTVSGKWDCIDFYGCDYKACAEKQALLRVREKRVKGVRDAEAEERLHRWGANAKSCSSCRGTAYCSVQCQKLHWSSHKEECRKARARSVGST